MSGRYMIEPFVGADGLRFRIVDTRYGKDVGSPLRGLVDAIRKAEELNRAGADAIEIERLEMESTLSRPDRFDGE